MKLQEWKEKSKDLNGLTDLISFANGTPDKNLLKQYFSVLKPIVKKIMKSSKELVLNYTSPEGSANLRKNVCGLLKGDNINCSYDEILITTGSQQAIKILVDALLEPGDVVMLSMPTYIGVEKPLIDKGVMIKDLSEEGIKKYHPKMVYLIPDFSNPTGMSMSLVERQKIVSLARKYGFIIVEDQTYRELYFDDKKLIPSIVSLYEETVVIGTVSKFMAPGLRIGWIFLKNKNILDKLILTKESIDLSTSALNQGITAELLNKFIKNEKILNNGRRLYSKKMNILVNSLNSELGDYFEWEIPAGGYYIWLKPKIDFDINQYWKRCLRVGVVFSPGFLFYFDNRASNELRLSIGDVSEDKIKLGVKRMKLALFD
jgi:2-aminoadipate transaminase